MPSYQQNGRKKAAKIWGIALMLLVALMLFFIVKSEIEKNKAESAAWEAYMNSPAAPLVTDELVRNPRGYLEGLEAVEGAPQEPYLLLFQEDPEKDTYSLLYYSKGEITEENLKDVRTVVWAEPGYKTQDYIRKINGASMGTVAGKSMYVSFYCIDVETGRGYKTPSRSFLPGSPVLDTLEAQPFPEESSKTVEVKYSGWAVR